VDKHKYNVIIYEHSFEWEERKSRLNEKKHRVSFEEAKTAFHDENALLIHDPDHSAEEDRFILLGLSARFRLLVVCHVYRRNELIIRVISARLATRHEQRQYWERLQI